VSKYQSLARELKVNIVPGTIVTTDPNSPPPPENRNGTESSSSPTKPILLNIAPFISYTGEVLGTYTKVNLWHPERSVLTSGPRSQAHLDPPSHRSPPHTVIETPLGPVGLLICWDLGFPEAFRSLIRQGARIIIIPTFWTANDISDRGLAYNEDAELLFLNSTLVARAFENTCCVIFCNAGGPKEERWAGLSQVAMPILGRLKGSFEDGEPGMRIVEVDMTVADVAEENYKVREDLARGDWHYGYTHADEKKE
jgi:predicted amidohydrolase